MDCLTVIAAQRWLLAAVAATLAAVLLMAFINTLHENMRQGETLRQAMREAQHGAGALRQVAQGTPQGGAKAARPAAPVVAAVP